MPGGAGDVGSPPTKCAPRISSGARQSMRGRLGFGAFPVGGRRRNCRERQPLLPANTRPLEGPEERREVANGVDDGPQLLGRRGGFRGAPTAQHHQERDPCGAGSVRAGETVHEDVASGVQVLDHEHEHWLPITPRAVAAVVDAADGPPHTQRKVEIFQFLVALKVVPPVAVLAVDDARDVVALQAGAVRSNVRIADEQQGASLWMAPNSI
mmetsp:Transcript_53939/g.106424  ORF Transcript_53939/g.106424 Transcript_53939/m.106424 type:complete len:211 (-) Transcript_53939:234-866(-)